jgi:hypothetical protein
VVGAGTGGGVMVAVLVGSLAAVLWLVAWAIWRVWLLAGHGGVVWHRVRVVYRLDGWRAKCSCGWLAQSVVWGDGDPCEVAALSHLARVLARGRRGGGRRRGAKGGQRRRATSAARRGSEVSRATWEG